MLRRASAAFALVALTALALELALRSWGAAAGAHSSEDASHTSASEVPGAAELAAPPRARLERETSASARSETTAARPVPAGFAPAEAAQAVPASPQLLQVWSSEEFDAEWTSDLSERLHEALGELEVDAEILAVSCRLSLCRVEVDFATLSDAERLNQQAKLTERQEFVRFDEVAGHLHVDALLAR